MKTVCLITPPSAFLMDDRLFVALGILKVAASLEQHGYAVEHLDLCGVRNYEDAVRDHAARSQAEVFGVTATTPQMPAAQRIADVLWDYKVILGGPHATLVCAAAKKGAARAQRSLDALRASFDVIVAGDGELAILEAVQDGASVIDADDPSTPLFMTKGEVEQAPWPARHLVDMDSYHYVLEGVKSTNVICQLGCPFACNFCGGRASPMLRRVRTRSTENVVAELRHLHDAYGYKGFMFHDDELNVNKQVVGLMDAIAGLGKELGVEWKLRGFVKSELFTDEQAEAMYRAGFRWLLVGFESGSPRILENINKKATREDNTRCRQICRRHGIKVKALMSLGHAGESPETIRETKDWLLEQHPDDFDATVITTYPGTPYFDEAVETSPGVWTYTAKNGDRLHAYETDWSKDAAYYKGTPGEYESFVFTDHVSAEELVVLRDELEADVRQQLGIPFNAGNPGVRYEASFGMLPGHLLRRSV